MRMSHEVQSERFQKAQVVVLYRRFPHSPKRIQHDMSQWWHRDDVFLPLLVGSWCLKMFVLLHQVLWLYYMIQHFVSSGKQPNSGPKRLRSNHQLFKFKIVPPAEKSSVISSPWVVPSFDDISNPPITKRRAGEV